jgi:hypothetical protein
LEFADRLFPALRFVIGFDLDGDGRFTREANSEPDANQQRPVTVVIVFNP